MPREHRRQIRNEVLGGVQLQDALEVGKQHLDLLPLAA
jgi:hypothetical protein